MKKLVYCLKSTYNSGGMERIVISKANLLAKMGYKVYIITTDQRQRNPFFIIDPKITLIDLNVNYDEMSVSSIFARYRDKTKKLKLHKDRLTDKLKEIDPDIIISTFGNEISFFANLKVRAKKVAEIHFSRYYRLFLDQSLINKVINRWISYRYEHKVRKLDAFVCLTEEDKAHWSNLSNVHVIPNFIDSKYKEPSDLRNKQVISVGRLSYQKGYDILFKAWEIVAKKHPDWNLVIYGDGELKDHIEKIRNSNLFLKKSVKIYSPVDNIFPILSNSSIYVLSSRYEGLPMVLLEAMSCGLPIVSFDCKCGPRDLLSNTNIGTLVPFGNFERLALEIISLIENEQKRLIQGKNSYLESEKYLSSSIIKKWDALFKSLLST